LVSTADLSGVLQLQSNGTTIATISSTGVQTNVGAPAFAAQTTAAQNIASSTPTKIAFDSKVFDTNTNYNTTNYRFTPTVAGYYQINGIVAHTSGTNYPSSFMFIYLYKNGVATNLVGGASVTPFAAFGISGIVNMNGSTDYIEIYVNQSAANPLNVQGLHFSASLARSA
jgi:hypothetical protein